MKFSIEFEHGSIQANENKNSVIFKDLSTFFKDLLMFKSIMSKFLSILICNAKKCKFMACTRQKTNFAEAGTIFKLDMYL